MSTSEGLFTGIMMWALQFHWLTRSILGAIILGTIGAITFGAGPYWWNNGQARSTADKESGKNSPHISALGNVNIGHIGDVINPSPRVDRTKNEGVLIPGNKPMPETPDMPIGTPQDGVFVFFGSNFALLDTEMTILRMGGEDIISVQKDNDNLVINTLRVFNEKNEIIARIDKDGFWVRPDTRKKWPDDSTLTVFDHTDAMVLRIEFLNKRAISIQGIFRHPKSRTVKITNDEMLIGTNSMRRSRMGFSKIAIAVDNPN